jgi:ribosomal protein S20
MKRCISILVVAFSFYGQVLFAQGSIESRLSAVETLIEKSSAAQAVEASTAPEAKAARSKAREALKGARAAQASGDAAGAERLLGEARQQMMQAVRVATPGVRADQTKLDFERRLESTRALISAQKRVSAEKGTGADAVRSAEQRLEAALALREKGSMDAARAQLEESYLIARASLGSMRSGDTLVRSLTFESKEEEYRYEVDRNDTHQMLLRVLLDGRSQASGGQAAAAVERARGLRAKADETARRGDHAAAIRLLEDSTGELVKAIRGAGVYIPG